MKEHAKTPRNDPRQDPRVHVALDVALETQQDFYAGITGNLSYGGVFMRTESPPAPGSSVQVDIRLPGGGRIRARGCVRWVREKDTASDDRPAGCGVAWQAIDRRSLTAVRRFLARQARLQASAQAA